MFQLHLLLFTLTLFITFPLGTPIKNGESVGKVLVSRQKLQVTNKELYPYMVHVYISHIENNKRIGGRCGGVIVGRRSILTAGHCLKSRIQPIVTVHAGILDLNHEWNRGVQIPVKEYLVHPKYTSVCSAPDGKRSCYEINDIAILWLERQFEFGDYIKRAKLNRNTEKPVNQKGWILGWGYYNDKNELPTMLQRGQIQVISQEECDRYNPRVHITDKMLCLKPAIKGAKSAEGDSGGPFEINGVVYGISSQSIFENPGHSWSKEINIYTDVSQYFDWLDSNLRAGPLSERKKAKEVSTKRPLSPTRHPKLPNGRPSSPKMQKQLKN